jgi:aromatic-L-amino-acid decarboxylase
VADEAAGREHAALVEGQGEEVTFREDGHKAVDWAADYLEGVGELPVFARVQPGEITARLPTSPPEEAEPFESVLRDLDEILLPGVTHWQHPRFMAYFAVSAAGPGILAELLAATLNNVGVLWRTAPASTELELLACDWVAQLIGLPPGWHGHIEDTASTSTLAALAVARHATGRSVIVCSDQAHSSIEKDARILGMETRKVATDAEFRLRPDLLELDGDVAAVVAAVGTTSTTSVDPIRAIAEQCADAGAWLHVDAAYAGSAMVCPELRWAFDGIELADTLVVNAHKWMFTPMDCSLLFTRRQAEFRDLFSLVPEYLRSGEADAFNISEYSHTLGRRFRALKLWAVLRCYGAEGLRARIREAIRLAELFEGWVDAEPGWELCAPRPFSVVCFRKEGSDEENEALLHRVNATGEIFISHTKLDDRYVLRLAVGNERTTEDDVRRAWDVLRRPG